MASTYKDLLVWQKSMKFALRIYEVTKAFPSDERFGLTAQLRRAAVSIPSNIAEGQGRSFDGEFLHFLSNALGSLMEVETQLELGAALGYVSKDDLEALLKVSAEIGRMLNGLIASLKKTKSMGAAR